MQERHLINLSLTSSIVGIFFLFLLVQTMELQESSSISASFARDGEVVKIIGPIRKMTSYDHAIRLDVIPQQAVSVMIFDNLSIPLVSEEGAFVEVTGRVEHGKHGVTILAEEVNLLHKPD
ncbi:hypothetical protein HYS47_03080 [Candidatus Woesearchaeota archaeon]|nr:hypothetical protein [Candidatus Woesearchaeota archaeon]